MSIVGSLAEFGAIGAVLPFLALLADPGIASRFPVLREFFSLLGWNTNQSIFLPATILFVGMAAVTGTIRIILTWMIYRFTFGLGADLGKEVYRRTLLQPYRFHVARNSSETIASLSKVQSVLSSVVNPIIQSAVSSLFVVAIAVALIAADPLVSFLTAIIFVTVYGVITVMTRSRLVRNSVIIAEMEKMRVQALQEGLGGIRDVIIDGTQSLFVNRFSARDWQQRQAQAANSFMSYAPRYVIESFGMILIALMALSLSQRSGGIADAIPILGALALGAQRALPQIQQIYYSWASMSGSKKTLEDVLSMLDLPVDELEPLSISDRLQLKRVLELRDVSFRYQGDLPQVVSHVSMKIERGARIGFMGKTGSGKSTLVDIVMGLLEPTEGEILIDGEPLTPANRRLWQATISHVPQAIYLADATIAENIAFGQDTRSIDHERVREAAIQARINEFVDSLPTRFDTVVGERGVRLSGGQRQRIGLARALYKRANVIVLDEATSALDNETEAAVMDAIYSISRDITVLIIAHRLSTLRTCDHIFELNNGFVTRECRHEDLTE